MQAAIDDRYCNDLPHRGTVVDDVMRRWSFAMPFEAGHDLLTELLTR